MEGIGAVRDALRESRGDLLARPNVVATGVGFKIVEGVTTPQPAIVCSVTHKVPVAALSASELVPRSVGGVVTDVVPTGVFRALQAPTGCFRPAPGGVSIGHRDITSGTLGCLVRRGGETFILSNNHVLANSNEGVAGDPILQPGPYDGGKDPDDRIAELADFVRIAMLEEASGCPFARGAARVLSDLAEVLGSDARLRAVSTAITENVVDCALARPLSADLVTPDVLGLGAISGIGEADLGTKVRKSGRTTGLTSGEIVQVDVTADIVYGSATARFTDQIMAGAMSQGGDSGSAVLDEDGRIVGLPFAGSDTSTLCNRIGHVFSALGVTL